MNAPFGQKGQPVLGQPLRRGTAARTLGSCQDRAVAVPEIHERLVARWCRERIPARAQHQVRMEYQVRGASVTLFERRAPWRPDFGPEWTSHPIAQLRYAQGRWRLYWPDRNARWHLADHVPPAESPADLLAVVADTASGFE
jgi:hypothetical protein